MTIRAFIFDLGNTLMYFEGDWSLVASQGIQAMADYLASEGYHLDVSFGPDFIQTRRAGRQAAARTDVEFTATQALRDTLQAHGHPNVPDAVISRAVEFLFGPEQAFWIPCRDAIATLSELKARGLRMGLISNATNDPLIQRLVAKGGMTSFLDPIISSAAVPWRKPDPRIFKYVLDQWQLTPAEAVMVGDFPGTDILGAHRAGMRAILIDQGLPAEGHIPAEIPDRHLLEPDATVHSLGELLSADKY